jgi:hypothetical protein
MLSNGLGAGVGHGTGTGGLAAAEQTCGSGNRPFMVFNPTGQPRAEVVVATIWDNDPAFGMFAANPPHRLTYTPFHVVAPDGRELPAQMVESGSYWGHHFAKFAFPVEAVPGFGYGLYTLVEGPSSAEPAETVKVLGRQHPCWYVALEQCYLGLENSLVRFKVDPASGGIASLLHKASGIDLVHPARPAAVLEYAVERPHGMSAWSLAETGPVTLFDVLSIEKKTEGTYVGSIDVRLRKGDNTFNVIYELRAGDALIVRLFETAGKKTTARITTDAKWLGQVAEATEVDVLERPLAKSAATAANGAARIVVPAYGLTTVRLTLKKRLSLPKAFPNLTADGEGVRKPGRSEE